MNMKNLRVALENAPTVIDADYIEQLLIDAKAICEAFYPVEEITPSVHLAMVAIIPQIDLNTMVEEALSSEEEEEDELELKPLHKKK